MVGWVSVSLSLPVSRNTLNPPSTNFLNNLSAAGIAGHPPLVAHALNPAGSNGSHLIHNN